MLSHLWYGYAMWFFLVLFFIRVLGQLIVVCWHPRWLPPMKQWYSGLIPYKFLLPIQILIILLMSKMSYDLTRQEGFFAIPRPDLGQGVVIFSYIYFASMGIRYIIRMKTRPDQRWFGGTIPIIFHCVLAAFLYSFGRFHGQTQGFLEF